MQPARMPLPSATVVQSRVFGNWSWGSRLTLAEHLPPWSWLRGLMWGQGWRELSWTATMVEACAPWSASQEWTPWSEWNSLSPWWRLAGRGQRRRGSVTRSSSSTRTLWRMGSRILVQIGCLGLGCVRYVLSTPRLLCSFFFGKVFCKAKSESCIPASSKKHK